jgi:N-acetylneuraminic acid mutarotase
MEWDEQSVELGFCPGRVRRLGSVIARGALVVVALLAMVVVALPAGAAEHARLPAPVYRTVAVAAGGRIYVLGGHDVSGGTITDVEVFDPVRGVARRAGSLMLPTHGAAAATLGGRILVFGGASVSVHDVVQQFFPSSGRSRVVGHMPGVRADVTATVVGKRVILAGGFDGVGPQSSVWVTRDGRSFTVVTHLPQPVRYPAVAAVGNLVYVFGGLISGGEYTGTFSSAIQRVDLRSGTARVVGHLPTPLAHAMAAVVRGRIYVLGGSAPGGPSDHIRRFDPARNRTRPAGRLPRPLTDAGVATLGSTVYLLGGISTAPTATITIVHPGAGR